MQIRFDDIRSNLRFKDMPDDRLFICLCKSEILDLPNVRASGSRSMIVPVRKERAVDSAFADSLYFAAGAFARQVEKLAKECWLPSGLTPSQGTLLLHLIYDEYSFPCFISTDLRVNPSSVTRLADQLEKKGLIERWTYKHLTYLSTTNKADELLPILTKCDEDFLERCDQLLGEGKTSAVAGFLNRATDKLTVQKEPKTK